MLNKQAKINIWVEKLGLTDFPYLLLAALKDRATVYYDEYQISVKAKKVLDFLKKLNICTNFYPAQLLLDKKDKNGYAMVYRLQDNLDFCLDAFCNKYILHEAEPFKVMLKSYLSSYLFQRVSFITMVECDSRFSCHNGRRDILFLSRSPLNSIVIDFCKQKGLNTQEAFLNCMFFKYYLRPVYLLSVILTSRFNSRKPMHNLTSVKPSVWIEYADSHNQFLNLAFWHAEVNKCDFNIVYYLDRDDDPPLATAAARIEERGFKWVDLHFRSLVGLAHLKFSDIRELLLSLFFYRYASPLWFRVFMFDYKMWLFLYKSVFCKFKARVLIQHQELSWIQQVQVDAIESVGGIMIGFHWSNFPFTKEPHHLTPAHVYFVWGGANLEWLRKKGNTCRYILPSGLWLTNGLEKDNKLSDFIKKKNFIIAIFDSSVAYGLHLSKESLNVFYLTILEMLEENKTWGGIVKSKVWNIDGLVFLPNGKEIISKAKLLIAQGRLLFFEPNTPPIKAFSNAHLSVCFGLNSAGIIAGIHGCRAVHWDCSGLLHNPLYKIEDQKVIFTDLEKFKEAIIEASNSHNEIGDFSKSRKQFNYFDDLVAGRRVGRFLQSFLEKSQDSSDFEHSLTSAVNEYISENNVDKDLFITHN